jgi:hypothetical protein
VLYLAASQNSLGIDVGEEGGGGWVVENVTISLAGSSSPKAGDHLLLPVMFLVHKFVWISRGITHPCTVSRAGSRVASRICAVCRRVSTVFLACRFFRHHPFDLSKLRC